MVTWALVWRCSRPAAGGGRNAAVSLSAANAAAILIRRAKRLKIRGIYFLYRVLQAFGLPVLILYFLFRGLRNRGYWRSLPQRFGFLPRSFRQTGPGAIWLHAVSVGEVLACAGIPAAACGRSFRAARLFVSTSTLAGRATAGDKLRRAWPTASSTRRWITCSRCGGCCARCGPRWW